MGEAMLWRGCVAQLAKRTRFNLPTSYICHTESHTKGLPNFEEDHSVSFVTARTIDFTNAYRGRGLNHSLEVEC